MEEIIVPSLNPREQIVLDCIPFGHQKAIGRRRLAEVTRLNDRTLREIIYSLVVKQGFPIGSSTGPDGGGYFLIQNQEDLEVATRHLKPRANAIFAGPRLSRRWPKITSTLRSSSSGLIDQRGSLTWRAGSSFGAS